MGIVVLGGMDRLERQYIDEGEKHGIQLKVFSKLETNLSSRLGKPDAFIIITGKISHKALKNTCNIAKSKKIPVYYCHSAGICSFRDCLNCIKKEYCKLCKKNNQTCLMDENKFN